MTECKLIGRAISWKDCELDWDGWSIPIRSISYAEQPRTRGVLEIRMGIEQLREVLRRADEITAECERLGRPCDDALTLSLEETLPSAYEHGVSG